MGIENLVPGGACHGSRSWKYTNEDLEKLFKVKRRTIKRWENEGKIDRSDLLSIIALYNRLNNPKLNSLLAMWERGILEKK